MPVTIQAARRRVIERLSFVLPVLDEADNLRARSTSLASLRAEGHEVIVVDGGSSDDTLAAAHAVADRVLQSPRGRAMQMNAGARAASGDALVFLHADTTLPGGAARSVCRALGHVGVWGRFDARLDDPRPAFRVIEFCMNVRSRLTGVATGDQAIFVRRAAFESVRGYPPIALMEDVALSRRLRRLARPTRVAAPVRVSARRWQRDGIVATVLLMWRLRLAYWLGASPERLARIYYRA